ncbi:hypothetical protein BT96DRAFT_982779, partial [Gymnopus androsaceus JB14]
MSWSPRPLILLSLVTIWMFRLSYNTYRPGLFSLSDEDYRWAVLRTELSPFLFQLVNLTFIAATHNVPLLTLGYLAYCRRPRCFTVTRSSSFGHYSASSLKSKTLAKLHFQTAPVSSIASNSSGTHLLTSSWDTLIGLWDTAVPSLEEVPEAPRERKKRQKLNGGTNDSAKKAKRKAPSMVLKSHTTRVSRNENTAYSCGIDFTTSSEKPFLDIALNSDGHTALAASTDRTVTLYDVRQASSSTSTSTSSGSLPHAATPSCLATGSTPHQVVI